MREVVGRHCPMAFVREDEEITFNYDHHELEPSMLRKPIFDHAIENGKPRA